MIGYKVSVFFKKFISLLGNRLWRDQRIQAFTLCLFEAGQKTIPSILLVPQALWWVFDLEIISVMLPSKVNTPEIKKHVNMYHWRTKILWYDFL